jgi:hypothetical protein
MINVGHAGLATERHEIAKYVFAPVTATDQSNRCRTVPSPSAWTDRQRIARPSTPYLAGF